jgi:hypothetical protein
MNQRALASFLVLLATSLPFPARGAEEPVGQRPYEMVWAGRTQDARSPLVDFEDLQGWTVAPQASQAAWSRSREQQLWGNHVGKLVYRGTGGHPAVTVKPPKPIPVAGPFDCVNLWIYGNNWAWAPDPATPPVTVDVLLISPGGHEVRVGLGGVRWKEWWLAHARLTPDQLAALKDGAEFAGIQVSGGRNKDDRVLYFDNLGIYKEALPPLEFEPRPKRGIEPFPGQTVGTNTGPGKLPFPTREETILPDNLAAGAKTAVEHSGQEYVFRYRGDDGELIYRYRPATGTLGDVTAQWVGCGREFQPMAGGGVFFVVPNKPGPVAAESATLLECRKEGETVVARWRCTWGGQTAEVTYTLRLWQKSLVVDVKCLGGHVAEFRVGAAVGVDNPRLVTLPYLACDQQRPAVLVTGPAQEPLFLMALVDHCRSNASALWAINEIGPKGVFYNGGSRYLPKTDGRRNDCFERLFLTVSPRFEEVLPNVPNPKSPWMHVAGPRLWRAHGASNREHDYALWKQVARYGMTQVAITDHETGWRDGGESFTFRTRAAPGKGGDEGQAEYSRKIRALGFRYGIYNNYTDYAPVNEHWNEDRVTRLSNGDWQRAWARCYNPKPARAVEFEARLAPIIQGKFHLDTAYCDVHTAVRPWSYCDFDARVPGAGTFAATFYAYGEIMLHQKKTWNGPVYSEGNNHWYYCGLTDGNYGQDQLAKLDIEPWLVDFDLRKLHPLCCNFGMGNMDMFFTGNRAKGGTPEEQEARLDRFLAATLAFGHTGFLVLEGGMPNAVRSYFNLQQVHAGYAQQTAADIRYADEHGNLLDASAAVATGAFRRCQIVTTYSNGMKVWVNGHPTDPWRTPEAELPPNGWLAIGTQGSNVVLRNSEPGRVGPEEPGRHAPARNGDTDPTLPRGNKDKGGKLVAMSAIVDGRRADYVDSPAYVYADGRGRFTRFDKAASDGQAIGHKRADGTIEVIPVGKCSSFGIAMEGRTATAVALDEAGGELGPAETRLARGLVYVTPVPKAFSYVLKPVPAPAVSLTCDRQEVVAGETVTVTGKAQHTYRVPADAQPDVRLWQQFDGAWIDFTVVPLAEAELRVGEKYDLCLTPHLPSTADAQVTVAGQSQTGRLVPGQKLILQFPFERPTREEVRQVPVKITAGDMVYRRTWWLKAEQAIARVAELSDSFQAGQCLRKEHEEGVNADSGASAHRQETACGDAGRPSLFMHPPYKKGVGYTFARFGPVQLPQEPKAVLRCEIGKADGSDPGDGILFRVAVVDAGGRETVVAERQWIQHAWTPLAADLAPWAGQRVRIKLVADVGPADNSSGDWAAWSNLRIESAGPVLEISLHDRPVEPRGKPGR